uniref:Uncharacterized protein n=1 Tax=Wuchereria bancrofti TaxID=6293 RepID=A0A1I8E911_WUCBA
MKLCVKDVVYSDSIFNQHTKNSGHASTKTCIYQTDIIEGVLDIHLDKDGRIYKNNRPITRNDQDGASALSKLEGASKTENGEALATTVQMRTTLRCLLPLAAPSTAYFLFSRAYSNGRGNREPKMFQLEHVRKRLEMTTPHFFRERLDYTFYRPDVLYKDEIFLSAITSRDKLMIYFGSISFEYIADLRRWNSTIKWRIKHISLIRSLLNPMLFKYDYRIKKNSNCMFKLK